MKSLLLRWLHVPPEPEPPPGESSSLKVFRAARNFYLYKLLRVVAGQVGALAALVWSFLFIHAFIGAAPDGVRMLVWGAEALAWMAFVVQLPFSYAMIRLDYEMRWYIVSDRSLRIREGILRVEEKTVTFANIQNMVIRQGPIQGMLGISDLEVRTAGGGSAGAPKGGKGEQTGRDLHTARFHGVDNAEEIREAIRAGLREHLDTGLGDPDSMESRDAGATSRSLPSAAVPAAREVLAELRALRASISNR